MASITEVDTRRMRERLFFEPPDRAGKLSAFWALLLLSG